MKQKHVLIVGGGFGGVKAALDLAAHEEHFKITLLSDTDAFSYHPTLYHTATGGSREVSDIPLKEILGNKNVEIILGHADKLNRENKTIHTEDGQKLSYDILILALGAVTNYFGIKGMQEYSYGIKSIQEAEELKAHLHKQLIEDKKPDLNYIIIGGGPTGVELAGALPGYVKRIMAQHGLPDTKLHIDLVEAAPHLMPRMPKSVSKAFERQLRSLGIKLYLGTPVQAETANTILMNGKYVRSHTVVWTAGIANNPFFEANGFIVAKNHKVQVDKLMQAWPGIFVIGDNADTQYSGMAQTALYDAHFVAENLIRHAAGERPYAYKPKKPIYVTPAGPHWASVVWGPVHLYGWLGWAMRQAADWIGYKDLEPWWRATELLLAGADHEDNCPICAANAAK
ncbi:MAG: dehydrogenase [Candidatus Saccharibacteria bacterium]|nr:dehydrogenase [Candidatus Saccharibacteria bacterium]